jgi:hypothetical protein
MLAAAGQATEAGPELDGVAPQNGERNEPASRLSDAVAVPEGVGAGSSGAAGPAPADCIGAAMSSRRAQENPPAALSPGSGIET